VTVRPGAGTISSDRVTLTWPDDAIRNEWVQVTIKADADTGLAAPDVAYFGNLVGETGDSATAATVTATDFSRTRAKASFLAPLDSPFDFNHDRRVNAADLAAVRGNMFQSLRLITAPAAPSAAAAVMSVVPASDSAGPVAAPLATVPRRRSLYDDAADLLGRVA
jgi:hypothetical protein